MAQANAIIVRIRKEEAAEFERLFEAEELPLWEELSSEGKFLQARLARVEYGSEERDDIALYLIYAEVPSMAEHSQHDRDPRLKRVSGKSPTAAARAAFGFWRRHRVRAGSEYIVRPVDFDRL